MADVEYDTWDVLWRHIDQFRGALRKSKALNVNRSGLREQARAVVQYYFRKARPQLHGVGVDDETLQDVDSAMQEFLHLAAGRNPKERYEKLLKNLGKLRAPIEGKRELLIGASVPPVGPSGGSGLSALEAVILRTLADLVPSAAASYDQALRDLQAVDRISWRGTAAELREVLREVLDRLAPDNDVVKSQGFKLEKSCTKPTMKQKVRFILKQRHLPSGALGAPEESTERVENATASLARSVYDRGSIATHVASTRKEVLQVKEYVNSVLSDLLEVHKLTVSQDRPRTPDSSSDRT